MCYFTFFCILLSFFGYLYSFCNSFDKYSILCKTFVRSMLNHLFLPLPSVTDFHHGPKSVLIVISTFIVSIIDVIIVIIITIMLIVRTRLGCSFSSWSPKETRCRLYDEPLARFIGLAQKYTKYENIVQQLSPPRRAQRPRWVPS